MKAVGLRRQRTKHGGVEMLVRRITIDAHGLLRRRDPSVGAAGSRALLKTKLALSAVREVFKPQAFVVSERSRRSRYSLRPDHGLTAYVTLDRHCPFPFLVAA
jgi:hypothetical protein